MPGKPVNRPEMDINGSSSSPMVAGIDGCRAGWIAFVHDGHSVTSRIIRSDAGLRELFLECNRIFIDMPVGLADSGQRACDAELRNAMPPGKKASVFITPVRSAVYAVDYREACDLNLQAAGRKISIQAWNITNRIRQVDELLRADASLAKRVVECHPEWQFIQFSGAAMPSKKTAGGVKARIELLEAILFPDARVYFSDVMAACQRKEVQPDDILDAMLLMVAARLSTGGAAVRSLPEQPVHDLFGLPMNICYVDRMG
jgi:predicted RNase H-like nuclease